MKTKARSFSIYLLKKGKDVTNSLKDGHRLDPIAAENLPEGSTLFVLDNSPCAPWWKSYFGIMKNLEQVTKGALIFLPVDDRCFAFSFGHVFHNLDDTSYEYDFGLKVTLNSVDPHLLKNTDTLEPGSARRKRTQVSIDSDLTLFDFDKDSAILKSLTGKVKGKYKKLFKNATGSSSLRISSALQANELIGLCAKLLELYASDEYKTIFPDIQNIVPVRDPDLIGKLNNKLLEAFRSRDATLALTVPDLINYNYNDNVYAKFSGFRSKESYEEVFMGSYYHCLEAGGQKLDEIGLDELKKHKLKLVDEGDTPKYVCFSILKCFVFDTSLPDGTYHITEGNWYKVEDGYVKKLKDYLDPYCVDIPLPDYTQDTEGEYNQAVAKNYDSILCFDREDISPVGQSQVEPCDLYMIDSDFAKFYHIKVSTFSSQLSHLFNQGTNAVELLKFEEDARKKLDKLVSDSHISDDKKEMFGKPLKDQKYSIVFGMVTHKDKAKKSLNLPLFSRISLMRNMKSLQLMSVPATFGFIQDKRKKDGKKKKRSK